MLRKVLGNTGEKRMCCSHSLKGNDESCSITSSSGATTQGNSGNDMVWGGGKGKEGRMLCKDLFRGRQCQVPGHGEKLPMAGGVTQCVSGKEETCCSWKPKQSQFRYHQCTARLCFLHGNCCWEGMMLGQK